MDAQPLLSFVREPFVVAGVVDEVEEDDAALLNGVEAAPVVGQVDAVQVRDTVPLSEKRWNLLGRDWVRELGAGLGALEGRLQGLPDAGLRLAAHGGVGFQCRVVGLDVGVDQDFNGSKGRQRLHPPAGGKGAAKAGGAGVDPLDSALSLHGQVVVEEVLQGHVQPGLRGSLFPLLELLEDEVAADWNRGVAEDYLDVAKRPHVHIGASGTSMFKHRHDNI
jgi:hypothetical protein